MKKLISLTLIILFFYMPVALWGQSKSVPRKYTCYFTTDSIVVDGKLDDRA